MSGGVRAAPEATEIVAERQYSLDYRKATQQQC